MAYIYSNSAVYAVATGPMSVCHKTVLFCGNFEWIEQYVIIEVTLDLS